MSKMSRTSKERKMTRLTPNHQLYSPRLLEKTYTSLADIGPSFGSYNPPLVGRPRLSSNKGLSIFLTDIAFTSSEVRKENDKPAAWELMEWAISILPVLRLGVVALLTYGYRC